MNILHTNILRSSTTRKIKHPPDTVVHHIGVLCGAVVAQLDGVLGGGRVVVLLLHDSKGAVGVDAVAATVGKALSRSHFVVLRGVLNVTVCLTDLRVFEHPALGLIEGRQRQGGHGKRDTERPVVNLKMRKRWQ